MLSRILVPVRGDGMVGTVLGHAAALAQRHRAHVHVVHCRARPSDLIPHGVLLPGFARQAAMAQAGELADRREDHLRRILARLAADLGLEVGAPRIGAAATCELVEHEGTLSDVVAHDGRLADVIVLAKPAREHNLGQSELRAAVYGAGRPVLMCPGHGQSDPAFGRHVAIGWNGSLPASRAVALTLDLVAMAETVTILTGNKGEAHGPPVEALEDYYRLRGIAAATVRFEASDAAGALLEGAAEVGAGPLVIGAYSQGREADMLFGGETQRIVDRATLPIVMAH